MTRMMKEPRRPQAPRVRRGITASHWTTLQEGVCGCFPSIEPQAFGRWQDALRRTNVEPEVVLFLVLVCGVQFQVYRIDPAAVMEELRRWLVSPPRGMRPQLADVVVRALAPGISGAVSDQWRMGPASKPIALTHRPPETRAAWAAATLTEELLRQREVGVNERERLTVELLQMLLARAVEPREYDRRWKETAGSGVHELVERLIGEYERLLVESAGRGGDPRPDPTAKKALNAWRERHRALTNVFAVGGFESGAQAVCAGVPKELWDPIRSAVGAHELVGTSDAGTEVG